jgi:hypothetical protein
MIHFRVHCWVFTTLTTLYSSRVQGYTVRLLASGNFETQPQPRNGTPDIDQHCQRNRISYPTS